MHLQKPETTVEEADEVHVNWTFRTTRTPSALWWLSLRSETSGQRVPKRKRKEMDLHTTRSVEFLCRNGLVCRHVDRHRAACLGD